MGLISIQDNNRTFFIDGGSIINPGKRQIYVILLDSFDNLLANDSVIVEFISVIIMLI